MIAALEIDRIVAEYRARRTEWEPLLPRRRMGYTRSRLVACDAYEVLALLWLPGALTPIHDHGDSYCATHVLAGELNVARYLRTDGGTDASTSALRLVGRGVQRAGDGDALGSARELHSVENLAPEDALSLHVYAPRYTTFGIYDESGLRIALAPSRYDAVLG
ncbi:MAG: cysteine dioxygenase family protein [Candidatus Eremiobacteraeota bacterium]|nr:cysteine dioxygenase family protein [Candidatus Eremiobacteraeota bacterium]